MRQINVYEFKELKKLPKEKAIYNYRYSNYRFLDTSEIKESYQAVNLIFDMLKGTIYFNEEKKELTGVRLYTWIMNNISYLWLDRLAYVKNSEGVIISDDFTYKYSKNPAKWSNIKIVNNLENCFLTGVCYDIAFLQNLIDFIKSPDNVTTVNDLLENRVSFESVVIKEEEFFYSDECIIEELESSDIEFLADGTIYK